MAYKKFNEFENWADCINYGCSLPQAEQPIFKATLPEKLQQSISLWVDVHNKPYANGIKEMNEKLFLELKAEIEKPKETEKPKK